jgi:hypothetical protein
VCLNGLKCSGKGESLQNGGQKDRPWSHSKVSGQRSNYEYSDVRINDRDQQGGSM